MYSVVIIGFGNIGKRHFESVSKNKKISKIYIFETNFQSVKNYKFNDDKRIYLKKEISKLNENIFLTIIATDSLKRYDVTLSFLRKNNTKNIIFEKFLFNYNYQFNYILKKLQKNKIKAYVNCNRRISRDYLWLKKVVGKDIISFQVFGHKWGFMSNSIHFIDLFMFLTGEKKLTYQGSQFDKKTFSKRRLFNEIHGSIYLRSGSKILSLVDNSVYMQNKISITTNKKIIEIYENKKLMIIKHLRNNIYTKVKMVDNFLVSDTTIKILNSIIKYNSTNLVKYKNSIIHHKVFLKGLNKMLKGTSLNNNFKIT